MKVSVSLVTYNQREYIAEALASALAQKTNFPVEIIVGDDGSTDGAREIVSDFANRFPSRIKAILHPGNIGPGANFRSTLEAATGDYVAFLDGDDSWTCPVKLQRQVDLMDNEPEVAVCFHNALEVNQETGTARVQHHEMPKYSGIPDLLASNYVATSSVIYRRELDRRLPPWVFDLAFSDWMALLSHARFGKLAYIPEVMSLRRIHSQGAWSGISRDKALAGTAEFYLRAEMLLGPQWRRRVRRQLARTSWLRASLAEKNHQPGAARRFSLEMARYDWRTAGALAKLWLRVSLPGLHRALKSFL